MEPTVKLMLLILTATKLPVKMKEHAIKTKSVLAKLDLKETSVR
jgi:hypothetical protein